MSLAQQTEECFFHQDLTQTFKFLCRVNALKPGKKSYLKFTPYFHHLLQSSASDKSNINRNWRLIITISTNKTFSHREALAKTEVKLHVLATDNHLF